MRITSSLGGSLILLVLCLSTARADAEQTRIDESASQVPSVLAIPAEASAGSPALDASIWNTSFAAMRWKAENLGGKSAGASAR
jgi:hypothetical protein